MQKKGKKQHKKKFFSKTRHAAEKKHKQLSGIEKMWQQVTSHKSLKQKEIQKHTEQVKPRQVFGSKQKLASLKTLQKQAKEIHKTLKETKQEPLPQEHMDKIKQVAAEITKHRITTDFDRVMFYVQENTRAKSDEVAKALLIDKKKVEECAKILEENGLIEIEYPIMGDIALQENGYREKMKKLKSTKQKTKQKK
ncbi:MAG: hypothetical protein AABW85_00135 [archaeon]